MDGSVTGSNAEGGGATGGNTVVPAEGNTTYGAGLQKVGPPLFVCCKNMYVRSLLSERVRMYIIAFYVNSVRILHNYVTH